MSNFKIKEQLYYYLAAITMDIGLGIALLCVPLYAIKLGATVLQLGILSAAYTSCTFLTCIAAGKLMSKINKSYILTSGIVIFTVCIISISTVTNLYILVAVFAIGGFGQGLFWPSLETSISENTNKEILIKSISLFNVAWSSGITVGSAVGGIISDKSFTAAFAISAVSTLSTAVFLYLQQQKNAEKKLHHSPSAISNQQSAIRNPQSATQTQSSILYIVWLANFINWFCVGVIRFLFPKLAIDIGISSLWLGYLFSILGGAQIITFLLLSKSKHLHKKYSFIFISQCIILISLISIIASRNINHHIFIILLILAFISSGIGSAAIYTSSIFNSLMDEHRRSANSGIHEGTVAAGSFIGPLVCSYFASKGNLWTPYTICSIIIICGIIGQYFMRKKMEHELHEYTNY